MSLLNSKCKVCKKDMFVEHKDDVNQRYCSEKCAVEDGKPTFEEWKKRKLLPDTENVIFNLNQEPSGKFHIHNESCYVMLKENGAGLAKINRALKPYHHTGKNFEEGFSAVGDAHQICIIREKLQEMRFDLL